MRKCPVRMMRRARPRTGSVGVAVWLSVLAPVVAPGTAVGHEVPADVTVQMYVRPVGPTLTLLVRAPLASLRDMEFPLRGPGYLVLEELEPALRQAAVLWIADYVQLYEDGRSLGAERVVAARVSLPSDRSFASFEEAFSHTLSPPLGAGTDLVPEQAVLDVLFEVAIESEHARFSMEPALAHLGLETVSVIHFVPPEGGERVFQYSGNPGVVHLDPRWHQAFFRFVVLGFLHILDGMDHLLFILCLVIPFRSVRGLIPVVTGFTVAHSITLVASAAGLAPGGLWFSPLVETLIAASILYMALENILGARLNRRWGVAFAFGLVHGFGFAVALRESLQFAGTHMLTSLLAFNVGVEIGQVFVLLLAVPLLTWGLGRVIPERPGVIVASAIIAHTAWHWMADRWAQLIQYQVRWPALDVALGATLMRWAMLGLVCAGAAWLLAGIFGGWATVDGGREPPGRAGVEPARPTGV